MTITFFQQSKKDPAPIYIRIREGKDIDAKARTKVSISPSQFKNGDIKLRKIPARCDAKTKKEIQDYNDELLKMQLELGKLKSKVTSLLNNRRDYEIINTQWLKNVIYPQKISSLPENLLDYMQYYTDEKRHSIRKSTAKRNAVFKNRVKKYEKENGAIYIQEVNKKFSRSFKEWCTNEEYAHNTIFNTLKFIKTVCTHAKENGIVTHPELEFIMKGLKEKKSHHIHLTLPEISKVKNLKIINEELNSARDWLVISCETAQRVSDFLKFSKEDIKIMEGEHFLDISQEKTGTPVYIPLSDEVVEILEKRNGEFPPVFSQNIDSNKAIYNRLIKKVCELAEIDDLVKVYRKNKETNRYEEIEVPKYKAVSTHIGRRSYATNYYGLINTALLISATGHSSETQFLRYVGKTGNNKALLLAKAMRLAKSQVDQKSQSVNSIKKFKAL